MENKKEKTLLKNRLKKINKTNLKNGLKTWLLGDNNSVVNSEDAEIFLPAPVERHFQRLNYTVAGVVAGLLLIIFLSGFTIKSILMALLILLLGIVGILYNVHLKNNIKIDNFGILEGTIEQIKRTPNNMTNMVKERKLRKPKAIIIRCNVEEDNSVARYKMPFYSNDILENMKIRVYLPLNQPLVTNTSGITVLTKHWGYELLSLDEPAEDEFSKENM